MDKVKKAWELFNTLTKKFELYAISDAHKSFPKVKELREISANYPLYVALVEEIFFDDQNKIFKSIVLTEEILLGYLNERSPLIKLPKYKTLLVALPMWIYLSESFLINYTYKRGELKDVERLVRYAETTSILSISSNIKKKFINAVMELLSSYNTESIFDMLDRIEKNTTIIRIPDELKKYFEEKFNPKS